MWTGNARELQPGISDMGPWLQLGDEAIDQTGPVFGKIRCSRPPRLVRAPVLSPVGIWKQELFLSRLLQLLQFLVCKEERGRGSPASTAVPNLPNAATL